HGVLVVLEEVRESGPGDPAPRGTPDAARLPADEALDQGKPTPTLAGTGARHGGVADLVADQRNAPAVQIRDQHLAAVARDLYDVALGIHVMAAVCLAFVRERTELSRSVLVEHRAAEDPLDEGARGRRQRLSPGVHGAGPVRVPARGGEQVRDDLE